MLEVIKTNYDLCEGCNRCVRECPMETANITYQDDAGNIKVKIDYEKCIVCGRCVTACKHDARYYVDDTERFFDDLSKGIPISLMVAPSVRTNLPDHKKLFTWLKRLGVNKIHDVSLGADISIWAHLKYLQKNHFPPIVTQPCPAVVLYCEKYRHDLLKWLSPVHGPTGCLSVYMKRYEGITDRIAALTPCIAKSHEFHDTGQAGYNITFSKLLEYLRKNNVVLPDEETPFDHDESGLGSLFPMPGGLKENIEYFLGKNIHITKAEGFSVYAKLNKYAATPEDFLPGIFDVLNCIEGCNIGPASSHDKSVFEIDQTMNDNRKRATEEHKRSHYESVYQTYDKTFDLAHFLREYQPVFTTFPQITDADIGKAFERLGKTDDEKQGVDCSACGSETCYHMARKIALGVNIPINCIVKSMEDAKLEHANSVAVHSQLKEMEKTREADERMRILMDTSPLAAQFWNENFEVVDCNLAAVKMFGLSNKQEYFDRYFELTPEFQPDGCRSLDKLKRLIETTYQEGFQKIEWMRQTLTGEPMPVEMTLVHVDDKGRNLIAGYCRDLREQKQREKELVLAHEQNEIQLAKLKLMVKATKIGLWDMDFNKDNPLHPENTIRWSDEFRNMLGYADEKDFPNVISSLHDNMHPEDLERIPNDFMRHLLDTTGQTAYDTEFRLKRKNGEYAYFHVTGETVRDENGNPLRVAGSLMDITETKKTLLNHELQLLKMDLMIQGTKVALWDMEIVKDDQGNPQYAVTWSDDFRHLLGFTDENDFPDLASSWSDLLHPDDKDRVLNAFEQHVFDTNNTTPYSEEQRLMKKNGEYAYFRCAGATMRDENGNPLRVAGALVDITETKNILLNSEMQLLKLNLTVQAAKIGLWDTEIVISDPINPGNVFNWSDEFRHMMGYTNENDFPNVLSSWSGNIHPDDKGMMIDAFTKHLSDTTGKTPFDVECRIFKQNGECACFRVCGETIRDSNGTPIRVAGALLDVTETKKLLSQAQEMEERTHLLLDAMPMCGKLWSRDMRLLACNDECRRTFGVSSKQEFIDRFFELSPMDQPNGRLTSEAAAEWLEKAFEEGYCHFDWVHQTPSGEPIPSEITLVRIHYKGDYVVAGFIKDLREHNRMMEEIRTTSSQLALESFTLKSMFDSVPDLIFCKDLDLNYSRCNESLLAYFNLQEENVIGKDDEEGLRLPKEKAEEFRGMDRKVMDERRIVTYEEYVPAYDGSLRLFETNKIPLQQDGEVIGIMGIARDITERKAMEEAAQNANRAKSAFLSTMSHEIRTPMNAILVITEIQLQNESLAHDVRDALEKIYASGDLLLGIINDILDLSKIEAGKLELTIAPYQIASLISDTAQLNMMRIGSKPIEFDLHVDENVPVYLLGDELRVKQILNNLLSNAFKYTAKGTVKLSIAAEAIPDHGDAIMLALTISDTGQGMTREQIGKLFDEYARFNVEANRLTEGTGLGMSITRNLIRLMNGVIIIESEPGKGTEITARLPQGKNGFGVLGKDMAENLRQFRSNSRAQMRRVQITREPMPYGCVLIVDDVETNIYVAKGLLSAYELKIDSAGSGIATIEKIKSGNLYDIIFMDHMMPIMDGMEATKILRGMGYDRPIVALTANAVSGQAELFLKNGFDDFISKPIDIRQLNTVLNELIRDKQSPEVLRAARQAAGKTVQQENQTPDDAPRPTMDPLYARIFVQDASKALAILEPIVAENGYGDQENLRAYIINVHGMKSALAIMERMDLSVTAGQLETAAREGRLETLTSETPGFISALRTVVEEFQSQDDDTCGEMSEEDESRLREKLLIVKIACEQYDENTADEVIRELNKTTWPKATKELLSKITEHLLHSDFDEIVAVVDNHANQKLSCLSPI